MNERTVSRIEGWESRPYSDGYASLRELADGGFTGAVRSGGVWLFVLNGRVVGVHGGTIEDFEGAEGTSYQAPHPSLPLLFTMLEEGGEQRAKYYTNDTPIAEAHQQLSDTSFTGYIELSENVLSGDYYVLYYGGRSMSCAFVGNSERLLTGGDAFETANDEVGIYEVRTVEIDVIDIPKPAGGSDARSADESTTGADESEDIAGASDPETTQGSRNSGSVTDPSGSSEPSTTRTDERADTAGGESAAGSHHTSEAVERTPPNSGTTGTRASAGEADTPPGNERSEAPATEHAERTGSERTEPSGTASGQPAADSGTTADAAAGRTAESAAPGAPASESAAPEAPASESAAVGETASSDSSHSRPRRTSSVTARSGSATDRGILKSQVGNVKLRAIPSLSPDRTLVAEPGAEAAVEGVNERDSRSSTSTGTAGGNTGRSSGAVRGTGRDGTGAASTGSDVGTTSVGAGSAHTRPGLGGSETGVASGVDVSDPESIPDDIEELRRELLVRQERIGELEAALTDLRVQRDGLTDERDRLQSEASRLESQVDELQEEIDRLRARLNDGTEGKKRLSPEQALEGTNLFIRYGSKSGGTLEDAHAGDVDREEVNENLRIEHHTQFDAGGVVIDGDDFETFLSGSIYRTFVEWVVRELLYEIRETGHVKGLRELYDTIPRIDRAELLGEVSVQFSEDGEQYREQRSFDVVLRDRMGNPLVVANLNDSRNPADSEMMETILTHAGDVETSNESLSSAIMVTSSFFQPGALEAAKEAVGGGLLSRDSKESYVKTARKSGYHLILVESRAGEFHINVPEL